MKLSVLVQNIQAAQAGKAPPQPTVPEGMSADESSPTIDQPGTVCCEDGSCTAQERSESCPDLDCCETSSCSEEEAQNCAESPSLFIITAGAMLGTVVLATIAVWYKFCRRAPVSSPDPKEEVGSNPFDDVTTVDSVGTVTAAAASANTFVAFDADPQRTSKTVEERKKVIRQQIDSLLGQEVLSGLVLETGHQSQIQGGE